MAPFASLDLFFFYFFHELALVPTFIMIGVWGRGENKNYATFQITLYLSLGALIALLGLIALYLQLPAGARTFDIEAITNYFRANPMPAGAQHFIFPLLMFGFGILVSLWPFHTWAPIGYGCAPSATAMLHAGVLKKFGLYGLIRVALPLMPDGAKSWLGILALLCLGNILYCGLVAIRQKDLNLLIGNSSVAHMGFAFLGIASLSLIGITGTVFVMIAHGLLAALTFGLSGYLYQQTGTLDINQLGGLCDALPFVGAALVMAMLAGCGLPGFANFPGELLVLFGAWKSLSEFVVFAAWGALVIGAVYMLRAVRNILHGPLPEKWGNPPTPATFGGALPHTLLLLASLLILRLLSEFTVRENQAQRRARSWKQAGGDSASALPGAFPGPGSGDQENRCQRPPAKPRLEMMNSSESCRPFGQTLGAASKAEAAKTAGVLFPSPWPPLPVMRRRGLARVAIIRRSLVVARLRNERQRSEDCNRNVLNFPVPSQCSPSPRGEGLG